MLPYRILSVLKATCGASLSLLLFVSRAACAFPNVISDKSDCGPDASTYLLCVSYLICPAG